MEWLDKLGKFYQKHFSVAEDSELTPKDVMRKIVDAMEEFSSEGIDGRVYVPNKYVVQLAVMNPDERAYLLSFLDEEELATHLEKHMALKNYLTRGPLDFTIEEVEAFPGEEKLYVRALFDKNSRNPEQSPAASDKTTIAPARQLAEDLDSDPYFDSDSDERIADTPTVEAQHGGGYDEPATVHAAPSAWAALLIQEANGRRSLVSITKSIFCAGRSRHGGNDLVLVEDGQVSKRHLRIEREPDGGATLYDLASTNGTFVNGNLVPVNAALQNGDIIEIGQTKMEFQRALAGGNPVHGALSRASAPTAAPADEIQSALDEAVAEGPVSGSARKVARLIRTTDQSEHILGSEALIGRSMTCDIVLTESSVSSQQARVQASTGSRLTIQDLSGRGTTIVNGRPIRTGERMVLNSGDRISFGGIAFILSVE